MRERERERERDKRIHCWLNLDPFSLFMFRQKLPLTSAVNWVNEWMRTGKEWVSLSCFFLLLKFLFSSLLSFSFCYLKKNQEWERKEKKKKKKDALSFNLRLSPPPLVSLFGSCPICLSLSLFSSELKPRVKYSWFLPPLSLSLSPNPIYIYIGTERRERREREVTEVGRSKEDDEDFSFSWQLK